MKIFNRTPAYTPAAVSYPTLSVNDLKALYRVMPQAQLSKELQAALALDTAHRGKPAKGKTNAGLNMLLAMSQLYREAVQVVDGHVATQLHYPDPQRAAMAFVNGRHNVANMPLPGMTLPKMPGDADRKQVRHERIELGQVRFAPAPVSPKPLKGILKNPGR